MPGEMLLLGDFFAVHRSLVVKEKAPTLELRLEFVRVGITGQVQLLDRRFMGGLKRRARQQFGQIVRNADAAYAVEGSVGILLNVWNDFAPEDVVGARDHFRRSETICH
jgi:hypothetical protein